MACMGQKIKLNTMKKIVLSIFVFISVQSFGQFKTYGLRLNATGTVDTIKHKLFTDSLFIDGNFVAHTKEYYDQFFEPNIPAGFGNYLQRGDGLWTNFQNQSLYSGTYTPTLTNVTNVAASTAFQCAWIRVGDLITVTGQASIDCTTAASTSTELGISLPVASNLLGDASLAGTAVSDQVASLSARIKADATNDRARIVFKAVSSTNDTYSFTFTYLVQ
jgi:hypothetical protein